METTCKDGSGRWCGPDKAPAPRVGILVAVAVSSSAISSRALASTFCWRAGGSLPITSLRVRMTVFLITISLTAPFFGYPIIIRPMDSMAWCEYVANGYNKNVNLRGIRFHYCVTMEDIDAVSDH